MDFVEIYHVYARKAIIEAPKRISNSDKLCRSYSDLNFGVTFWNTVYIRTWEKSACSTRSFSRCVHEVLNNLLKHSVSIFWTLQFAAVPPYTVSILHIRMLQLTIQDRVGLYLAY